MESFFSVFATGRRDFNSNQDTDLAEVGGWLERLASVVNLDIRSTQRELYRRLLLAVCTGNGDMHLQNLSFLGGPNQVRLSPIYDPAPMRAWPRHDVRLAVPLDFDDKVGGFGENMLQLGAHYGLTRAQSRELLAWSLDASRGYPERVMELDGVPQQQRQRLVTTLRKERGILRSALNA
jgi:serine/threonine-protein kinase HipA